jgi:hypothetical protein
MKSILQNFLLTAMGFALSMTVASAAPWPPAKGDLILGVQATGGTGATSNVFFNLGPAHVLRDNPNPGGVLVNLDAELVAAFGDGWELRTDLYFGVFANRSNATPSGLGSVAPENGDPARTIYASKGVLTPGSAAPWTGYSTSSLGLAATAHSGQIEAIDDITANGNGVATLTQGANPVQWNNGWSKWNPTPGAAFSIFTGGIQARFATLVAAAPVSQIKMLDVFRIPGDTGIGTYETTVYLTDSGDLSVSDEFFSITGTATNGAIQGLTDGDLYAGGSTVSLTAVPDAGYGFTGWSGAVTSTDNPLNLLVDSDKAITANFALLPGIDNPTFTGVTGTAATLGAEVLTAGSGSFTERGVVYSAENVNDDPEIGGASVTKVPASGTTGVFTVGVTTLSVATTYAFKGFATSSVGTVYTDVVYFTTDTTVDLPGGIGTVSDRMIRGGDSQLFRFNLATASPVVFSGTGMSGFIAWEIRDAVNVLVDSGTGNVDFEDVLDSGDYSLRITNDGDTEETFSLDLDASDEVTVAPSVTVAPALITSKNANPVTGTATIRNNSALADTFRVSAGAGNSLFGAAYFNGAANITAGVITGTYQTPSISQTTGAVSIRAAIKPNKKKLIKKGKKGAKPTTLKKTFSSVIRATSSSNPAISAAGQLTVRTR